MHQISNADPSASSSAMAVVRDDARRGSKWDMDLLEDKVSRQVMRAQEQMERFLQVIVQPLEAKVAAYESKHNSVVLRLAELSGNIKGLKEEVEVQARRSDAVEGRFQRWKKSLDAELRVKHEEFRRQLSDELSREMETLRAELDEKGLAADHLLHAQQAVAVAHAPEETEELVVAVEDIRQEVASVWNVIREIAELEKLRVHADPGMAIAANAAEPLRPLEAGSFAAAATGGFRSASSEAATEPTHGLSELQNEIAVHRDRILSLEEVCDHLGARVACLEDSCDDALASATTSEEVPKAAAGLSVAVTATAKASLLEQADILQQALAAARQLSGPPTPSSAAMRKGGRLHLESLRLATLHEDAEGGSSARQTGKQE